MLEWLFSIELMLEFDVGMAFLYRVDLEFDVVMAFSIELTWSSML